MSNREQSAQVYRKKLIAKLHITEDTMAKRAEKKERMLKEGNPYEINKWIEDTYGISADEMIDAIVQTGDILQIYEFLYLIVDAKKEFTFYKSLNDLGISNEKLSSLEDVILKSRNAKLIRYCIGFVPGIDLDRYLDALYGTNSFWDIRELSEGKEYTDENEVENPELIERVKLDEYKKAIKKAEKYAQSGEFFPKSLEDYKEQKDDIDLLMKKVIETKSPYLICELANYVQHSLQIEKEKKLTFLEELANAELSTHDAMGIYEFLSSVNSIFTETPKGIIIEEKECVSEELYESMVRESIKIAYNNKNTKFLKYINEYAHYEERMGDNPILDKAIERIECVIKKEGDGR